MRSQVNGNYIHLLEVVLKPIAKVSATNDAWCAILISMAIDCCLDLLPVSPKPQSDSTFLIAYETVVISGMLKKPRL